MSLEEFLLAPSCKMFDERSWAKPMRSWRTHSVDFFLEGIWQAKVERGAIPGAPIELIGLYRFWTLYANRSVY